MVEMLCSSQQGSHLAPTVIEHLKYEILTAKYFSSSWTYAASGDGQRGSIQFKIIVHRTP